MKQTEDDAEDPETPKPERFRAAGLLRFRNLGFMLKGLIKASESSSALLLSSDKISEVPLSSCTAKGTTWKTGYPEDKGIWV